MLQMLTGHRGARMSAVGVTPVSRQPRGAEGNSRSRASLLRPCCRAAGSAEAAITQYGGQRNAVPAQLEECALQTSQKKRDQGIGEGGIRFGVVRLVVCHPNRQAMRGGPWLPHKNGALFVRPSSALRQANAGHPDKHRGTLGW